VLLHSSMNGPTPRIPLRPGKNCSHGVRPAWVPVPQSAGFWEVVLTVCDSWTVTPVAVLPPDTVSWMSSTLLRVSAKLVLGELQAFRHRVSPLSLLAPKPARDGEHAHLRGVKSPQLR